MRRDSGKIAYLKLALLGTHPFAWSGYQRLQWAPQHRLQAQSHPAALFNEYMRETTNICIHTLASPLASIKILDNLTSRWSIPFCCKCTNASTSCLKSRQDSSSLNPPSGALRSTSCVWGVVLVRRLWYCSQHPPPSVFDFPQTPTEN